MKLTQLTPNKGTIMNNRFRPLRLIGVALIAPLALQGVASAETSVKEPRIRAISERGELSDQLLQRIKQLDKAKTAKEMRTSEPPTPGKPDTNAPAVALPLVIERIDRVLEAASSGQQKQYLRKTHGMLVRALQTFRNGTTSTRPKHLAATVQLLAKAQADVDLAKTIRGSADERTLFDLQEQITQIAYVMAKNVLEVARNAGVSHDRLAIAETEFERGLFAFREGDHGPATTGFGKSLAGSGETITFDVDLFEENIISAMSGQAVGYALSITFQGQTHNGGYAEGLARTAADAPVTNQSPNKDMHVASVSKTLTAIVVLNLLEELGLSPDEPVAPYLPSNWTPGAGVAQLTFRDFMTHRSGFDQQHPVSGSSYANLQALIAEDVGSQIWSYDNDNFALMRVAVAGLLGIDPVDWAEFAADQLTSAAFLIEAESLYNSIGVSTTCESVDPSPTIQYNFPDTGATGFNEPSHTLSCGGYGWHINANELAGVMATLRQTEQLLNTATRSEMQDGFLGLMDPSDGYSSPNGDFGLYYSHGGDWNHGPGELHACAMAFPIVVEASLLINSERGAISYQCQVLTDAFDNAWTP